MIDERVHVALDRPVAAGRVRREPTPRLDGEVSGLLHRLDGEIAGRLDHHGSLATDPGDDGGPIFVIMTPPGLALLPAPTRAASQVLWPSVFRLPLAAGGVIEFIRFYRALHLALG